MRFELIKNLQYGFCCTDWYILSQVEEHANYKSTWSPILLRCLVFSSTNINQYMCYSTYQIQLGGLIWESKTPLMIRSSRSWGTGVPYASAPDERNIQSIGEGWLRAWLGAKCWVHESVVAGLELMGAWAGPRASNCTEGFYKGSCS